jgi:hypothetical protein
LDAASALKLVDFFHAPDPPFVATGYDRPRAALERPDGGAAIADKSPQC